MIFSKHYMSIQPPENHSLPDEVKVGERQKLCFQTSREKGIETSLNFGSDTSIYTASVEKPPCILTDQNWSGKTVISFHLTQDMTFRGLSVKERQMEKSEDLVQSILLLECIEFILQWRLRSIRGVPGDARFPREESCPENTCCSW